MFDDIKARQQSSSRNCRAVAVAKTLPCRTFQRTRIPNEPRDGSHGGSKNNNNHKQENPHITPRPKQYDFFNLELFDKLAYCGCHIQWA
jgi:hypothetical protein